MTTLTVGMLSFAKCEFSARLTGLQPRLARDAASCSCTAAASSAWSARWGRDQPDERSHRTAETVQWSDGEADKISDCACPRPARMRPPPQKPAMIDTTRRSEAGDSAELPTVAAGPVSQSREESLSDEAAGILQQREASNRIDLELQSKIEDSCNLERADIWDQTKLISFANDACCSFLSNCRLPIFLQIAN